MNIEINELKDGVLIGYEIIVGSGEGRIKFKALTGEDLFEDLELIVSRSFGIRRPTDAEKRFADYEAACQGTINTRLRELTALAEEALTKK